MFSSVILIDTRRPTVVCFYRSILWFARIVSSVKLPSAIKRTKSLKKRLALRCYRAVFLRHTISYSRIMSKYFSKNSPQTSSYVNCPIKICTFTISRFITEAKVSSLKNINSSPCCTNIVFSKTSLTRLQGFSLISLSKCEIIVEIVILRYLTRALRVFRSLKWR